MTVPDLVRVTLTLMVEEVDTVRVMVEEPLLLTQLDEEKEGEEDELWLAEFEFETL